MWTQQPSNINLGISICSFEVCQALQPCPAICSYGTEYTILIDVMTVFEQGRSQDFSNGGSHWVIQRVPTRLPPECCGLFAYKKFLQKGDHGHSKTPLATPLFLTYLVG